MGEFVNRCSNCTGVEHDLCSEGFQLAVAIEEDIANGEAEFEAFADLADSERLDVTASSVRFSRDEFESTLRILGCTLTREEIDQNIMAQKG